MTILSKACIVLFFIAIEAIVVYMCDRMPRKKTSQILWLMALISTFYILALCSPITDKSNTFWLIADGVLLLPITACLTRVHIRRAIKECDLKKRGNTSWFANHVVEIALVVITAASRFWLINTTQKWDCGEYYYALTKACYTFDFRPVEAIYQFKLLRHPSQGFCFFGAMGVFCAPDKPYGILGISLVLTCAASVSLYRLFTQHWSRMKRGMAFLGTVVCLTVPLFWTATSLVMPDYFMTLFMIFMMDADRRNENLMVFFWGVMAAFCKEVGMVLVAAYFLAKALVIFFGMQGKLTAQIKALFTNRTVWAGVCIAVAIIGYLFLNRSNETWSHSVYYSTPLSWSGSGDLIYNTFGIQADNIITRCKEFFVVNFAWVLSLLLTVSALLLLLNRGKMKKRARLHKPLFEVGGVLAVYAVFMCLYITAGSIRYNVIFSVFYTALTYVFITTVLPEWAAVLTGICLVGIMSVQSFQSIDFVTNRMFRTVDVGEAQLLCISQSTCINPGGDYYITNLQYRSIHENFEKMFEQVGFQPEDTILVVGKDYVECNKNIRLSELNGRHMDVRLDLDTHAYTNRVIEEGSTLIRTLTSSSLWGLSEFPDRDAINDEQAIQEILDGCEGRLFVYFSPLFQSDDEAFLVEQLSGIFELGQMWQVETNGNVLRFCELKVKSKSSWKPSFEAKERLDGDVENQVMELFYRNLRDRKASPIEDGRTTVRIGDEVNVLIACYDEEGRFINMGIQPKGTVNRGIRIGCGDLIDNVDMQLVGHEVGSTIRVSCDVPGDYQNYASLAGKHIEMDVTIANINSEVPQVNDELIYEAFGITTLDMYLGMLTAVVTGE